MPLLLGAHTIDNGGIDMAALRAGNADMSALQIFTTIPKYYGDKQSIRPERVERFKAALKKAGIDAGKRRRALGVRAQHGVERRGEVGARARRAREGARALDARSASGQICFHPGAATGGDRASAAKRVAKAITHALQDGEGRHARADREHRRRGAHDGAHAGRDRDDARGCARVAARAHGLRARHLPSLRGGARHHRVARGASRRSSTSSRKRRERRRRSFI